MKKVHGTLLGWLAGYNKGLLTRSLADIYQGDNREKFYQRRRGCAVGNRFHQKYFIISLLLFPATEILSCTTKPNGREMPSLNGNILLCCCG